MPCCCPQCTLGKRGTARAKRTNFSQTLDERLGEGMNHLKAMHLLRFPFSVIEDRNPNGGPWLRGVLAEAR